jgi:tetratricopeptide (TPR) repeat protein
VRPEESAAEARWRTAQDVFWAARELPDHERERYLASSCGGDAELLAEVRRLLAADRRVGILDRAPSALALAGMLADVPAPERVGPYVVAEEIGRGGMGVVYRAHDPRLRRDVALKFLPAAWRDDRDAESRFIDEARAASALDHPYNCPVYDVGTAEDGRLYIAMAYCPGGSLAARLASGPLPLEAAVRVAVQVAEALDAAHEAGIVHRDVKPANIAFTERGDARVLDFGIAVLGAGEWAAPRLAAGTPAYMAPEQVRGGAVDRRTDVWALGVVLYEALTGRRPFDADDRQEIGRAILEDAPADPRRARAEVPPALARVVARALEKDPARRFDTAAGFAEALRSTGIAPRDRRGADRRLAASVGAAAVAALVAGAYLAARASRAAGDHPPADSLAVVVLPFRVRGDPSIEFLGEGMVDLLSAKLTGEGGLRATDPRTSYRAWRSVASAGGDALTRDSAIALARRLGAGNVLLGDVVGTASSIVVNASVVSATGAVVSRASAEGAHTELSPLVDRLVAQLLSVGAGEEPQRLAALTSTSLPALRAYLAGQAAYRRGEYAEALEKYGLALDLDSTFALAGLGLDLADGWVGTGHARERGRAAGWRWRERLSERDRALLLASVGPSYPRPSTIREQLDATENARRLAPDRVELWYTLGDTYFHYGRVLGIDAWDVRAEEALRRAATLDPAFAAPAQHLLMLYARQRRTAELSAAADRLLAADPEGATADYVRWRTRLALGEPGGPAETVLDSMATETLGWIGMTAADDGVAFEVGRRAVRLRAARPGTREERVERQLGAHAAALNAGRPEEARALSESLTDLSPDPGLGARLRVLSALYGDGDRAAGERAAAARARGGAGRALDRCVLEQWRLSTAPPAGGEPEGRGTGRGAEPPAARQGVCDAVVAAMRARLRDDGRAMEAVAQLDSVLRTGPVEFYFGDGAVDHAPIVLARLLEASGDRAGALAALRRRPYFIGWQPFLAASLRDEGRLAAALGDLPGAVRAYEHYLALRSNPEPALAGATDSVRAELARLRATAR